MNYAVFREQLRRRRRHFATNALCLALSLAPMFGQDGDRGKPLRTQDLNELSLEQLLDVKVTSASLHEQSAKDAPANVTVITAAEIQKYGYRTLADALSYVREFFFTSDHTYTYLGARGFSLPGDYDTRMTVMIDGHSIADNIFEQSPWFGNDFPVDIDLVDRIEVIRGSSSALYGSNGMLTTINVITKKPSGADSTAVRFETGSLGERKVQVSTTLALPKGANLLFSTSVFNNTGAHQLYFPEFDSPATNFGRAIDMDGEKGFHAFLDFTWGNWEVLAVAGDRVKQQPISWGPFTVFNDRGTRAEDSRGFVDVSYTKAFEGDRTLTWRTSYDAYRYRGIYRYFEEEDNSTIVDNREQDYGDWIGSKISYRTPDIWGGYLTGGAELRVDLRTLINVFDAVPAEKILRINRPDRYAGIFGQQEWTIGEHWELNVGARFDGSWLRRSAVSPRAALIYKPASKTAFKFLASRGFKNPSSYNMFYQDNGLSQIDNPALRPEYVNSFEIDFDQQLGKYLHTDVSVYHYQVDNLIQQVYTPSGLIQYVNDGQVRAAGVSFEIDAQLPNGIEMQSSLALQRAVFGSGTVLPNSPGQLGKFRGSMPVWRRRLNLGIGLQAVGQRSTYGGGSVPWLLLPEAVLSTRPFAQGFQFTVGVKNLSNSFYREPAGLSAAVDSMIGNGRTYYLSMNWRSPERNDDSGKRSDLSRKHDKPF